MPLLRLTYSSHSPPSCRNLSDPPPTLDSLLRHLEPTAPY